MLGIGYSKIPVFVLDLDFTVLAAMVIAGIDRASWDLFKQECNYKTAYKGFKDTIQADHQMLSALSLVESKYSN